MFCVCVFINNYEKRLVEGADESSERTKVSEAVELRGTLRERALLIIIIIFSIITTVVFI